MVQNLHRYSISNLSQRTRATRRLRSIATYHCKLTSHPLRVAEHDNDFKTLTTDNKNVYAYNPVNPVGLQAELASMRIELALSQDSIHQAISSQPDTDLHGIHLQPIPAESQNGAAARPPEVIEIFLSFVSNDESHKDRLEDFLAVMKRQRQSQGQKICITHKDNIGAGHEWRKDIERLLSTAHIILLLVSVDFLRSEFCATVEMTTAIERHFANEARVIPVILGPCSWRKEVFKDLKPLPKEGKPVTKWRPRDEAFQNIIEGIERAIDELLEPYPGR